MSLKGRTAVVTGGTGALGSVVVRRLVSAGAGVVVAARAPAPRIATGRRPSGRIRFVKTDVTSEKSVAALFRGVARREGRADILVNCAGGFASTGTLAETSSADWDRMMSLNLRSVFLCSRAFLRQGGARRYGRIVNISAQTVYRISRGRAPYAVAKGAVAELTQLLGEELRGTGTTVNAIAPSILRTKENAAAMPGADPSAWVDPEEVAAEIVHLCAPSAGAISGAVLPMFGGVKA